MKSKKIFSKYDNAKAYPLTKPKTDLAQDQILLSDALRILPEGKREKAIASLEPKRKKSLLKIYEKEKKDKLRDDLEELRKKFYYLLDYIDIPSLQTINEFLLIYGIIRNEIYFGTTILPERTKKYSNNIYRDAFEYGKNKSKEKKSFDKSKEDFIRWLKIFHVRQTGSEPILDNLITQIEKIEYVYGDTLSSIYDERKGVWREMLSGQLNHEEGVSLVNIKYTRLKPLLAGIKKILVLRTSDQEEYRKIMKNIDREIEQEFKHASRSIYEYHLDLYNIRHNIHFAGAPRPQCFPKNLLLLDLQKQDNLHHIGNGICKYNNHLNQSIAYKWSHIPICVAKLENSILLEISKHKHLRKRYREVMNHFWLETALERRSREQDTETTISKEVQMQLAKIKAHDDSGGAMF